MAWDNKDKDLEDSEESGKAAWNMALATLKEIRDVLKEIRFISTFPQGTPGEAQHTKWRLVKQLFVQSTPLLEDHRQPAIKTALDKLKPAWVKNVSGGYMVTRAQGYAERFDPKFDADLDDITVMIQDALQAEGYFMPPKEDLSGL